MKIKKKEAGNGPFLKKINSKNAWTVCSVFKPRASKWNLQSNPVCNNRRHLLLSYLLIYKVSKTSPKKVGLNKALTNFLN